VSSVESGDFIDDAFERYRFKGSVTFWPASNAITAFGVIGEEGKTYQFRRQMRLKKVGDGGKRAVFSVQSLHVDPTDQWQRHNAFFSESGEKLYLSVKRLSANEYMYFINDNWVFMCRLR
jgi:hypothetical protein